MKNNIISKSLGKFKFHPKLMLILFIFTILNFFTIVNSSFGTDNINSFEYLKIQIDNDISFGVEKEENYDVDFLHINSYFFPRTINETQYLNEFKTSYDDYSILEDSSNYYLQYNYNTQTLKSKNTINNQFTIESTRFEPKIKNKEQYPISYVSKENQKYLQYYDLIDVDNSIKNKASELARNKDDTFIIVTDIANWIQSDIKYDLSTVTSNPNQKSTQTFQLKTGVCKEITNLFVSMLRSLGIPARVVSGYAYTDSAEVVEFVGSNWGGHAWAEVLIDDVWVPFDLTYKQYGYVDASHIILKQNEKNNINSISVNGSGYGFNLVKNSLASKPNFEIIDKKERITSKRFDIQVSGPEKISTESYGYLKIDVTNLRDSYQVLNYQIAKTKEVEELDPLENIVILKPNEEKTLYFRYQISGLAPGYSYTLPFSVYNQEIQENYEIDSRDDYMSIRKVALPPYEDEIIELSKNNLKLNCTLTLDLPQNDLICSIKNPNNYEIENFKICLENQNINQNDCQTKNLRLNEQIQMSFKTDEISQILNYEYEDKKESIKISIRKPILNFTTNLNNDNFEFTYDIENFANNGLELNFYDENSTLVKSSNLQSGKISIPLEKQDPSYLMKLEFKNTTFVEKSFQIKYTPTEQNLLQKTNEKSENFIANIFNWIINLFA